MEPRQAEQENEMLEAEMEMGNLDVVRRPRDPPANHSCCFKYLVVLAAAMGLVIAALVVCFILQVFKFPPSCKQDAEIKAAKVTITHRLKESDENGRYDIFTADKAAKYLVYGWVKISNIISEEVILNYYMDGRYRTLEKKQSKDTIFFFNEVTLVNDSRISIFFKSTCMESLFHIYEL